MKSFSLEIPLQDWETVVNCWNKIEHEIKSDSKMGEYAKVLNDKLFNTKSTSTESPQDISIETMNKIMNEIDIETNESKEKSSNDSYNVSSNVMKFIQTPVTYA